MKRISLVLLVLALVLSACSSQATSISEKPNATQALQPTATAEPALQSTPTQVAASGDQPELPKAQAVVYQIVAGESQASYEVGETFFNQNNRFNVAVGVTSDISGAVELNISTPSQSKVSKITVDISKLKSDSGRRDNTIRERFLESGRFPVATFVPTSIEGLPATYTEGQEISFKVTGDLIVHETTQPVTFDVTVKLSGDTLTGTATTTILMSNFGIGPIKMAGILGTEDEVKLTFNFVASP